MGVKQLYDRTLWFQGSANACPAFLHDHPTKLKRVRFSELHINISWPRMADIFTYGFPMLGTLTVRWDKSF